MKFAQISAGRDRSVALSSDGQAFAWGNVKRIGASLPPGYPGELCTSSPSEIGHNRFAQPWPQLLNPGAAFSAVSDGFAETLAVGQNGKVLVCRPVVSPSSGAAQFVIDTLPSTPVQLVSTELAAFAVYADGAVWSWGMFAKGQLGRDAASSIASPAKLTGMGPITRLAAGHGHVLALDDRGAVWTWGANSAGQLGVGDLGERSRPTRIALPALIKHIAAGDTHSFALDVNGQLWGWGANNFGQLGPIVQPKGKSTETPFKFSVLPLQVRPGFPLDQIDAGMFYTVATSTSGDVFAWGWNGLGQLGQLGQNGLAASAKPLRVAGLSDVQQISAGLAHILAVNGGGIVAWGDNRASACGAAPSEPVQVGPAQIEFV